MIKYHLDIQTDKQDEKLIQHIERLRKYCDENKIGCSYSVEIPNTGQAMVKADR